MCADLARPNKTRSRSQGRARNPENRERHPLSLAARWGGVSDYERLKCSRLPRGYLMLRQVTLDSRYGVSSFQGADTHV